VLNLLLEGFSKEQINKPSGGPKNIDMLFSADEIRSDFNLLNHVDVAETNTILDEGVSHRGEASVIRVVGAK